MTSLVGTGDFRSPDSTITSLLGGSGHLRSGLLSPEVNTTIRYGDKDYESASEALEAYIADFERGRQDGRASTGRLVLFTSPTKPKMTLRNKDVLREQLTDGELDFLNLPASSHHDRVSMTTEELLTIPCDGSMPVTRTSAFLQGSLPQCVDCPVCHCALRPPLKRLLHYHPWSRPRPGPDGLRSILTAHRCTHPSQSPLRTPRPRGGHLVAMSGAESEVSSLHSFKITDRETELNKPHPCWVFRTRTSSAPDLDYQALVQHCHGTGGPLQVPESPGQPLDPDSRIPAWLADLEDCCDEVQDDELIPDPPKDGVCAPLVEYGQQPDTSESLLRDENIVSDPEC
ncbi:lung adenoma susceptibility protein 2 [Lampris incognitus]|uniref:lung adenoma susceptibility protein 2 n=1 Tax=Lampris incognitus TaxID=2546036 RepID=UPI0024B4C9C4|nr:lung adenoma susceptibility protein 2 [Lampris incognitus]